MNHFPKLKHSVKPLSHSVEIYQDLKYAVLVKFSTLNLQLCNFYISLRSCSQISCAEMTLCVVELMQAFLETQIQEHPKSSGSSSHHIFTDSDIAVVDDLGHIFHKYPDFHVALTFRNNKNQPLNSGFIAVRGTPDGLHKLVKVILLVL